MTKAVTEDLLLTWPAKMGYYGACILSDRAIGELFEQRPRPPTAQ